MKIQVVSRAAIEKAPVEVFAILTDFNRWSKWSPWSHNEPTAKNLVGGRAGEIGHRFTWEGEVVGAGEMTISNLEINRLMEMKLEFLKPWKSVAQVVFQITEKPSGCEVSWTMNSSLPIFMFLFKKMMTAYIRSDFDRGLRMLKDLAETGDVPSRSVYHGAQRFDAFWAVGRRVPCAISEIPKVCREEIESLETLKASGQIDVPDFKATLSHRHDIPNGVCKITLAYGYRKPPLKVPQGFAVIEVVRHSGLGVDHFGPYRHIANAWSMAVSYQRGKKFKLSKSVPSYEVYKTMPGAGPDADIHTQVVVPIR